MDSFADLLFGAAEAYNQTAENKVMVTIGLQIAEEDWFQNKLYEDSEKLRLEAEFSLKLAEELSTKYLESDSFLGWYLPFEIDNYSHSYLPDGQLPQSGDARGWGKQMIDDYFKPVAEGLYLKDPEKIIMTSPLVYARQENQQDMQNWNRMVQAIAEETKINVLAPQDGLGWGNSTLEVLQNWYQGMQKTLDGTKVHFYNNAENYTLEGEGYKDLQEWFYNIDGLSEYVEETITISRNQEDPNTVKFSIFKKKATGKITKITEISAVGKELYCVDNTNIEAGDIYIVTAKSAYGELDSTPYPNGKMMAQTSLENKQTLMLLSQDKINKSKIKINREYVHYSPLAVSDLLFDGDINPYNGEPIHLDGRQWYDTAIGFFGNQKVEIEIPFYGEEKIKNIAIQIPVDHASGVYLPSQINAFYSSDNIQYEKLGASVLLDQSVKSQDHYIVSIDDSNNEVKASSIKIVIEPSSGDGWTFID